MKRNFSKFMVIITTLSNSGSTLFLLFCKISKDGFGFAKNFNVKYLSETCCYKFLYYFGIFLNLYFCTISPHQALHLVALTASILCSHKQTKIPGFCNKLQLVNVNKKHSRAACRPSYLDHLTFDVLLFVFSSTCFTTSLDISKL